MSLSAPRGRVADVVDQWGAAPVVDSTLPFEGIIFNVRRDRVDLGAEGVVTRDYIEHPGAVVVVAVHEFDGIEHVLLIQQYRHPAGGRLWELPAGLLDVDGEVPWLTAARELAEEVDLAADTWHVLVDDIASPGMVPETVRIFLARNLRDVDAAAAHTRTGEELGIRPLWVPLDDAVAAVLSGGVSNAAALIGILAAGAARARDWQTLRAKDAPWPARELQAARSQGRPGPTTST